MCGEVNVTGKSYADAPTPSTRHLARVESWLLDQAAISALAGESAAGTLSSLGDRRWVAIVIDGADAIVVEVLELVESVPVSATGP